MVVAQVQEVGDVESCFDQWILNQMSELPIMDTSRMNAADWFRDVPWSNVPEHMRGTLTSAPTTRQTPQLLGGSSKLAKLAEERRRKAAADAAATSVDSLQKGPTVVDSTLNSLDRLSLNRTSKDTSIKSTKVEAKRYPVRKKKEDSPPPREPSPPLPEPQEIMPDMKADPSEFAMALSSSVPDSTCSSTALRDALWPTPQNNPFAGPSPDDTVRRAQQGSKGLNK